MQAPPETVYRSLTLVFVSLLGIQGTAAATLAASPDTVNPNPTSSAPSIDLRSAFDQWGVQARPQGRRGTCSVFTVTAAIEYALAKSGHPNKCLSVEFLNWASNQTVDDARDGGFFSDLWNGFEKYGICNETEMPYRKSFDPNRQPSSAALTQAKRLRNADLTLHWIKPWDPTKGLNDEQFDAVKATLRAGWPVCGGFLWPKQAEWIHPNQPDTPVTIPRVPRAQRSNAPRDPAVTDGSILQWAPRNDVRDGHSIIIYGFRDDPAQPGGVFLIRNSSRGARHGAMTYQYVRAYMNDAVWVESKAAK
jgi:C1A family cysteine protease